MRVLKILGRIVLALVVLGAVIWAGVFWMTRDARETGRNFAIWNSSGDYARAHELLHEELAKQFTPEQLAESFAGTRPYVKVRFTSIEADGSGTKLTGTANTADGCTSRVNYDILAGKIIAFNITPLCRN